MFLLLLAITMLNPLQVNNTMIGVGTIGPGQTLPIYINPIVSEGGKLGLGGRYDLAYVSNLPSGWKSIRSKLYGNPLMVTVKSSPESTDGLYYATITVVDEDNKENLGNISFNISVYVKTEIMKASIDTNKRIVNVNQPARFHITVENLGNAPDTFIIEAYSPTSIFKKGVYVEPKSSVTVRYEFTSSEEEQIPLHFIVYSSSSSKIRQEFDATVIAKPNLLADYRASANGLIIFPIFEAPIQLLGALISNFFVV